MPSSHPNRPRPPPRSSPPPRPLTWAARVAGVVAASPHALPPPRSIPVPSPSSSPSASTASTSTTSTSTSASTDTNAASAPAPVPSLPPSSSSRPTAHSSQSAKLSSTPPLKQSQQQRQQQHTANSNLPANISSKLPTASPTSILTSTPTAPAPSPPTASKPAQPKLSLKQIVAKSSSPPAVTTSATAGTTNTNLPPSSVPQKSTLASSIQAPLPSSLAHPHVRPPRRRPRVDPASIPPRRLKGLINGGNCCFINVVLQALLACDAFRVLLNESNHAPAGSLLQKFVLLADRMQSSPMPNGHAPTPKLRNGHPTPAINGRSSSTSTGPHLLSLKEGAMVKEEPILADWFYDVFPSSSGTVGGNVTRYSDKATNGGSTHLTKQNLSTVIGNGTMSHGSGSQEDAEEFLTYILNALHEELVAWEGQQIEVIEASAATATAVPNGINGSASHDDLGITTVDGRIHTTNGTANNTDGRHNNTDDENVWTEMTRSGKGVEIRGGEFAQSGVTEIFGGALRSEVKRLRGKASVTREPFFSLSLDIESGLIRDVEHALLAYFEPETLEGYNSSGDGSGIGAGEARKHVLLMQTPQTLILHLKRFSHNSITGALNKVTRNMMFPEVLRLPGKVMHKAGSRWGQDTGPSYQLQAVVTHVGKELAGGHYTADVRWDNGKGDSAWFMCDDSKITASSWQKVCRKQAYLLFYCAL